LSLKKKFIISLISLLNVSLLSCDNKPLSTVVKPSSTVTETKPVTPAPTKAIFRVFLDGIQVIDGINPLAEYSTAENKYTFYTTLYDTEKIKISSYAIFEIKDLTTKEINDKLEIGTDPNYRINATVNLASGDSPNKAKTTYSITNARGDDSLVLKKMDGYFKASIAFKSMPKSDFALDFTYHDLRFDFEFPFENGKLKTYSADSLEMKNGVGYIK
jgi:hypothetical protein